MRSEGGARGRAPRRHAACFVAGWLVVRAWACAQAPHEGFATGEGAGDAADAGERDAAEVVVRGDGGTNEETGAADAGFATDSASGKDTGPAVDAANCTKVGASKTCGLAPQ